MLQLLTLLGALILGYIINRLPVKHSVLNNTVFYIVFLILFTMGYGFASTAANLFNELGLVANKVVVFDSLLLVFNLLVCNYILRSANHKLRNVLHTPSQGINYLQFIKENGKYVLIVLVGIISGVILKKPFTILNQFVDMLLFVMLFIIGHQMRMGGIALKRILFNKTAILLAFGIIISSLCAGTIASLLLGIKLSHGLMLSSGFGWYSLSGVLNAELINQQYGTASFFIDFVRELVAITLLPSLGRYFPVSMVGYCGGTAMDFTLPVIKANLHEECVLIAVSSGMLLSIATPTIITLLSKF